MSQIQFINAVKNGAISGWHKHKVLPSVSIAQAILESGWGGSDLSKAPNYNLFGIKASEDWTGEVVNMPTQEWSASKGYYWIRANFRKYNSWDESIEDHGSFFTSTPWRKQNYARVIGEKDYKVAAKMLRECGYATDVNYPNKLIKIVDQYNLTQYDRIAFEGGITNTSTPSTNTMSPDYYLRKTVGDSLSSGSEATAKHIDVTFIGDSLLVGTEPKLKRFAWKSATYNAKGSRQWTHTDTAYNAIAQLKTMLSNNQVHNYVVFVLGTNRGVTQDEIKQAVDLCGAGRKILLVDTLSEVKHREAVSQAYKQASEQYSNVFYGDWSRYSKLRIDDNYYKDGPNGERIHMTPIGYERHANFIMHALYQMYNYGNASGTPKNMRSIADIEYDDGIFTSPIGETIIYNKKLNDQFSFKSKKGSVLWIEKVLQTDKDDPQEAIAEGVAYMKEHAHPAVQYTVKLKELPDTVAIGDIGIFVDHEFNPPLAIEARILNITTSETNKNQNTVTIGNVRELFPQSKEDIIALQKQLQNTREELLNQSKSNDPYEVKIEATNGLVLSGGTVGFETELIQGYTNNVVITSTNNEIYLFESNDLLNTFMVKGKLNDKHLINRHDGLVADNLTTPIDYDPTYENPQGSDTAYPLKPYDSHELEVPEFKATFYNATGQVVNISQVPIYLDGNFSLPIVFTGEALRVVIEAPVELTFDKLSIIERVEPTADIETTELTARVFKNGVEVTDKIRNFVWSRVSTDGRADEGWNDLHKFKYSNKLTVNAGDVKNGQSTFNVKVLDNMMMDLIASTGVVIKTAVEGKSAYQLAVEAGFNGSMYEWIESLKGSDGSDGTPGQPGADGKPTYIHTAWADDENGLNFSVSEPGNRAYVGFCVTDTSNDPMDYKMYDWQYVKGPKGDVGPQGLQGLQGPQGNQGIQGSPGPQGKSSYTHIAYATGTQGQSFNHSTFAQATHIGVYTSNNQNSSGNWRDYEWTLIKGRDGAKGLPGPKGEDGRTPFFHTAYANSADGKTDFSITNSDGKRYIGTYTDYVENDSTDPSKYKWVDMVGSVEVGGRNLLKGTTNTLQSISSAGVWWNTFPKMARIPLSDLGLNPGDEVVFSGFIEPTDTPAWLRLTIWNETDYTIARGNIIQAGKSGVSEVKTIIPPNTISLSMSFDFATAGTKGTSINYRELQLERGNVRSDWTPAPEDIQSQIDKSIKSTDVEYYLSTSSTSLSGGSWQTTAPKWENGKYMWSRTKVVLNDGTTQYRPSANGVNISGAKGDTGAKGETGATGTGISSITEEYYLSTSKTTQTGGSWVATPPKWENGKFIWTRSKIVYTNPSSTKWTTPIVSSEWEAVNELVIGGTNLLNGTSADFVEATVNSGTYFYMIFGLDDLVNYGLKVGDELTLSMELDAPSGVQIRARFEQYLDDTLRNSFLGNIINSTTGISSVTFKLMSDRPKFRIGIHPNPSPANTTFKFKFRKVKLERGSKATDWSPSPQDIQSGIDSKADSEATEKALNETISQLQTLQQEVQAAALDGELKDFIKQYNEEQKALDEDKKESNKKLQEALNSVSLLTNNMNNMSETWNFVDRYIKNTPQGIVVGNHEEGSYILIKEDRLSFFSNNEEVAFIAQNLMEISRGAFVEQIQISQYIFEKYGTNQLAIRYAG